MMTSMLDRRKACVRVLGAAGLGLLASMSVCETASARDPLIVDQTAFLPRKLSMPAQPPQLSSQCRTVTVAGADYRRPLRRLSRALRLDRPVRVLAIGSSSTAGVGASEPSASYVARLETSLEGALQSVDFDVVPKGMSGEVAQGAADRMRAAVAEVQPDIVIWQVGTNDAIRHVDVESFKNCVRTTVAWLDQQGIDVVLVDPQYGEKLAADAYYGRIVSALAEVASATRVTLVDRFYAMREVARERGDEFYLTKDRLHLNDTGHRCMAEQLARSIVAGILQADMQPVKGQ